jgi:DUF4097 and DUF4098 domain-containing protein YvlB
MQRQLRFTTRLVLTLGTAILLLAATGYASERGPLTQEFHQTYPLSPNGRVELNNLSGPVHITGWDRNEVKVDAVKRAWKQERMDETRIEINSQPDSIYIHTEYPGHDHNFTDDSHDNPASVEYTLTVPRHARLDEIKLVNGSLDIQDVAGDVRANSVNGKLHVQNLQGRTELNTVNGELDASVSQMPSAVDLSAVNGTLRLTLPSDAKADLKASTLSGEISNNFGLPVHHHQFVGHSLNAELGGGGAHVKLSNVNGKIEILRANDNRPVGTVKNLERNDHGDDNDRDDDDDDEI